MAKRLGRVEVVNGMRTVSRTQIRCDCGEELVCMYNTNTCDCGRDYNMSGQMLGTELSGARRPESTRAKQKDTT